MDPIFKHQNALLRVVAAVIASLLMIQVALAGAVAPDGGAEAGSVICAAPNTSNAADPSTDAPRRHRHGLCCILHCGALTGPPPKLHASIAPSPSPAWTIAVLPTSSDSARRIAAKGAPQSPRAPPSTC